MMKIFLATDHAGFEYKEYLKDFLREKHPNFEIQDFGAYEYNSEDDYPDFISRLAQELSSLKDSDTRAFIFGGSGQGEAIVANRYKGVRAAVIACENIDLVRLAREHNNANVLSFGARFVSEEFVKEAALLFLDTDFSCESRHARRIAKIDNI